MIRMTLDCVRPT